MGTTAGSVDFSFVSAWGTVFPGKTGEVSGGALLAMGEKGIFLDSGSGSFSLFFIESVILGVRILGLGIFFGGGEETVASVSYTHLTLPTNREV